MGKAIVILDYNNVFCLSHNLTVERRQFIMSSVLRDLVQDHLSVDYIDVRLYGGWYQDNVLTRMGSQVMSEHLTMDFFPILTGDKRTIYGRQKVVESIHGVEYIWYNTYREKQGIPRLIINRNSRNELCDNNKNHCPVHILEHFARKKTRLCSVEGCETSNGDAFIQMGQKMVDAMMVCDIFSFSESEDVESIYILTDDVDLFPALAMCRSKRQSLDIRLGIVNGRNVDIYREYLSSFNIKVFQIYDAR